jgi:SulP family sulfate permease|tara:strand:- start:2277 stop:3944 length:1668 start_codon:yes stop_codon:yes gene_type:complete
MDDSVAALIVAIMLIPQSLGLSLVAGLPPETGLYASIFGLAVYSVFGTSSTLSVAPVAVISLMTAAALAKLPLEDPAEILNAALLLALLSGIGLFFLGLFRLGFMANFLSHPVISAFVTASALIIGMSQIKHLLGIEGDGHNLIGLAKSLFESIGQTNLITLGMGIVSIGFILWCKAKMEWLLVKVGLPSYFARVVSRTGPVFIVVATSLAAYLWRLDLHGLQLLGEIPSGIPKFRVPQVDGELLGSLAGSAALIAIIGFVESISVAQTLAAKRREHIDLDQELVGLGSANIVTSFFGGFPVSGGFSRSVVNFDAGAATPAAGLITAVLVTLVALFFTPLLFWLPKVSLAAIILVAVIPLVDFSMLQKSWRYSKADFTAVFFTLSLTLLVGVEFGIAAGVLASILIHLYKTSQPHVAVVGRVAGSEHFRNVKRHDVETFENLLSIRIDESLYFANTRYLEELVFKLVAKQPNVEHVILMFTAVNAVDLSALETLAKINDTLSELGISLHLSEVKGPIMDRLEQTEFFRALSGNCYLSQNRAVEALKDRELPLSDF